MHTFVRTKLWVLWLEAGDSMLGSSGSCYTLVLRHPRVQPLLWEWRQQAFHLLHGEGPWGPGREKWQQRHWVRGFSVQVTVSQQTH